MPDASSSDPQAESSATSVTNVNGGVNLDAQRDVIVGGDVVGRDKITVGYTVEQVSTLLTQISNTFQPKPFDGRCPYLGLDAFSEDDADRFFGRETLVSELIARVKDSRFVVIAGSSGSGKSSLVRAGLLHALKQGTLPNSDRWLYATLTPGRDPIESLALAMSRLAKSPAAGKYVRDHCAEQGALQEFVESQLSDRKDQRAVIFVDQFEEVFTQATKEDERLAFLNLLTQAATRDNGRVTVLYALRSDFVSNCATYPQLNALLNQQFMQVGAMQSDELVSAIARPALQVGLRIDPDLIAQIVNDMQDEPGALPLMQFALKDLFDAKQAEGGIIALTLSDYLEREGLRKALERHADAAFGKLSETEQELARTIFSSLIEIGRSTQDTRRMAAFDELVPANGDTAPVKVVVQKLADARLITTDEQDHKETVTLAHETLIRAWPWLQRLVNENREAIALQNQIAEDAQEWDANQRDASYLYVGARLANAREQLIASKFALNELAQAFVDAGIQAEESERQREEARRQRELDDARKLAEAEKMRAEEQTQSATRLRRRAVYLIGALGAALLLGIAAGIFGVQANQAANANATFAAQIAAIASRLLAEQARSHMNDHFDLALLLSMEAYRVKDTPEARDVLLNAVQHINAVQHSLELETFLHGHTGPVHSVSFSPDGRMLASGSGDNTIILWDVSNPKAPVQLGVPLTRHTNPVYAVVFSPDGKMLASGGGDNMVILWDVSNPTTPSQLGVPLTSHISYVESVAFSPDGKTLASGSRDEKIFLWDVTNPKAPIQSGPPLISNAGPVYSVAFSPDGKTLASGTYSNSIILWDVASRQQLERSLNDHTDSVWGLAFSPDGKTLASGGGDNKIILWDVSNPNVPVRLDVLLKSHTEGIWSVAISPDGKTLASGSRDGTIVLWDVSNLKEPVQLGVPLTSDAGQVYSVAFSPDSKTLAAGSCGKINHRSCTEGEIILWDVDPISWQALACQSAGRNFTRAEWAQYFGDEPYRKTCEQWPLEPEATPTPIPTP